MTAERGASARHLARELLVKALYQWQLAGQGAEALVALDAALDDPAEDPAEEPARLSA